ncbi:MAG: hypothetical protein WED10_11750 [Brumimicrobium sp.]
MKFKHLLVSLILLISTLGYSQYNYEVQLVSFNDMHPKEAFSIILKKLDYSSKQIIETRFRFESRYKYTEDKLRKIMEESGFELKSFTMTKNIEKIEAISR